MCIFDNKDYDFCVYLLKKKQWELTKTKQHLKLEFFTEK